MGTSKNSKQSVLQPSQKLPCNSSNEKSQKTDNSKATWSATKEDQKHTLLVYSTTLLCQKNNTSRILYHFFLTSLYHSIVAWNIFDAYLSILAKEHHAKNFNTWVGLAECLSGAATLLTAIPFALLTDSYDRVKLSRLTGYMGIVCSIIQIYIFASDSVPVIYFNLFLWGVVETLEITAVSACFADSIPESDRLTCMTLASIMSTIASITGPLTTLCMFRFLSNQWTLAEVRLPLLAGSLLGPVAFSLLLQLQPQSRRDNTESTALETESSAEFISIESIQSPAAMLREPLIGDNDAALSAPSSASTECNINLENHDSLQANSAKEDISPKTIQSGPYNKYVPYIVSACELITAAGAGMTVRFFSLFFINDYQIRPIGLCSINIVLYALLALTFPLSHKLSSWIGRSRAALACQASAVVLLYLMAHVYWWKAVIVIYIFRSILANGSGPINKSILLDYSDEKDRGKWSLVTSFGNGLWSMSALVGSILADMHDYRYTFTLTAILYLIDSFIYLPLVFIVKENRLQKTDQTFNFSEGEGHIA